MLNKSFGSEVVMNVVGRVIRGFGLPPLCHASGTFLSAQNGHLRVYSRAIPRAHMNTRGRLLQVTVL